MDILSVFRDTVELPRRERLMGNIETEVLVIGGGMTGVLCAYMLKEAGVDCVLCEANRIASGVTGCTTAKVTAQHGLIYGRITELYGKETAALYLNANLKARDSLRRMSCHIECDYEDVTTYVYTRRDRSLLLSEEQALEAIGYSAEITSASALPFPTLGAIGFRDQGQLNPLKLIRGLIPSLDIYENSRIVKLSRGVAHTHRGKIRAKKIIVATHFPFLNKHGAYPMKLHQSRSYVLAAEGAPRLGGAYIDEAEGGFSFREYGELLFIGSGSHRTGEPSLGWQESYELVRRHFPDARIRYKWAAQDCMTLDGIPYIGAYSKNSDGLFVACGYNKWGMTGSMVAAELLTDMILERSNEHASLFDPSRRLYRPALMENIKATAKGFLTPRTPRCPHLGCALKWNKQERSWDCPCHGSRFDKDGKILDNPANRPANPTPTLENDQRV